MSTYRLTPYAAAEPANFEKRALYAIDIHWEVLPPPNPSKRYKQYVKCKPHIEYMVQLFGVMSTDEMYKIILAIGHGKVPKAFSEIAKEFYRVKKVGGFVVDITIEDLQLWNYENNEDFIVPSTPVHEQRKLIHDVPDVVPVIPTATMEHIQALTQNAERNVQRLLERKQ